MQVEVADSAGLVGRDDEMLHLSQEVCWHPSSDHRVSPSSQSNSNCDSRRAPDRDSHGVAENGAGGLTLLMEEIDGVRTQGRAKTERDWRVSAGHGALWDRSNERWTYAGARGTDVGARALIVLDRGRAAPYREGVVARCPDVADFVRSLGPCGLETI